MSSQHKRPFLAFVVLVVIAAAVVGANAFRANAERARLIAAGPIAAHSSVVHGAIPVSVPGTAASPGEQRTGPDGDTAGPSEGSAADTSTGPGDASSDRARLRRDTAEQRAAAHPMAAMIFDAGVPEDPEVPAVPAPAGHLDPAARDTGRDGERRPDDAADRPSVHQGPDPQRPERVRELLAGVLDGRRSRGPWSRAAHGVDQHGHRGDPQDSDERQRAGHVRRPW